MNAPQNQTIGQLYPKLLTRKEAADFLNVSQRTLDKWHATGYIPEDARVKLGARTNYKLGALIKWMESL